MNEIFCMDIDEFLEAEGAGEGKGARKELVEKQAPEFLSDLSIEAQIGKIRELLQANRYKEAEKIYFMVREQYATLAKRQEEMRRKVHRELTAINKELLEHLNQLKGEIEQKTMIINDLLLKAGEYMQRGNIEKANQLYLEVRQIFKQIPDAFAERKMLLENQILTFYSKLVTEFNKKNYGKLLEKRDEIMRHVEIATNHMNLGNVEQAKREYQDINRLYNELPEGFLYEKTLIYKRILTLHQLVEEGAYKETKPAAYAAGIRQQIAGTTSMLEEGKDEFNKGMKELETPPPVTASPPASPVPAADKTEKKSMFGFMKKGTQKEHLPLVQKGKKVMDAPPLPI